jgi:hypothetical protein
VAVPRERLLAQTFVDVAHAVTERTFDLETVAPGAKAT